METQFASLAESKLSDISLGNHQPDCISQDRPICIFIKLESQLGGF